MSNELCDNLRFHRYQGDTWILPFEVTNAEDAAVDIDDALEVVFALFDQDTKTEIFRRALDSAPDPITLAGNVITVIVPDTLTASLEGDYLFEMQLVDVNSYRQTVARGTATVVEDLIADA